MKQLRDSEIRHRTVIATMSGAGLACAFRVQGLELGVQVGTVTGAVGGAG